MILALIRRVESSMNSHNNPFGMWVCSSLPEIIIKECVLLAARSIGMLRRKMNHMHLAIVEGKPEISLSLVDFGEVISVEIGGIVVIFLVISNTRHEGCIGGKTFS